TLGERISAPNNSTFLPDMDKIFAKFVAINDLPSPEVVEVTYKTADSFFFAAPSIKEMFVRKIRMASAKDERSFSSIIGCSEAGISPKIGAPSASSISLRECTLLSSKNLIYSIPNGIKKPKIKAPSIMIAFLGATGAQEP